MSKIFDIQITNKFKKQYSKISKQPNFKKQEFEKIIEILMNNKLLPVKYKNHLLTPKSNRNLGMPHTTRRIVRI